MAITKTAPKKAQKVDQKYPPGALMSARIEMGGNGVSVSYDHAPEPAKKGEEKEGPMGCYQPRRADFFSSIEEACHAIVQAAGGSSEVQYEEDAEAQGEKADEKKAA